MLSGPQQARRTGAWKVGAFGERGVVRVDYAGCARAGHGDRNGEAQS